MLKGTPHSRAFRTVREVSRAAERIVACNGHRDHVVEGPHIPSCGKALCQASQRENAIHVVKVQNIPCFEVFVEVNAESISRERDRSVETRVPNDCVVDDRGHGVSGSRPRRDPEVFRNRETMRRGGTGNGAGFSKNLGNPASPSRLRETEVKN